MRAQQLIAFLLIVSLPVYASGGIPVQKGLSAAAESRSAEAEVLPGPGAGQKLFSPAPQQSGIDTSWIIERVDEARLFDNMGNRSLAVDASGYPHIAYGEDSLYYAHDDGTGWQIEMVDAAQRVGWHTSLALDTAGQPHISYCRWICLGPGGCFCADLKYAHYDGVAWAVETVDSGSYLYVGDHSSLALDSAGNPHISYCRRTCDSYTCFCSEVRYARYDGSAWHIETIDTGGDPSLALDAAGLPHASYCRVDPESHYCAGLRYARYDGTSWITTTVDSSTGSGTSLALDAAGRPHIGYSGGGGARYAHYDGTSWITVTVDSATWNSISLALDAADWPHLSYIRPQGFDAYDLRYARFDGSSWIAETVTSGYQGKFGLYTALALDGNALPAIVLRDGNSEELRYARCDGATWSIETVDREGLAGVYPSLVVDAHDQPHVSYGYQNAAGDELRYAHHDGTSWQIEVVDEGDGKRIGLYSSLALDTGNLPHISYYDASNGDLKYAYYDGATWITETVDSAGNVGQYTSLALDANGYPHVSYHDVTRDDLKYAYYDGVAWISETVDGDGTTGRFTSLALDAAGRPHISYCAYDSYSCRELVYAHYSGVAWITETVANGGSYTSLALDAAGQPHIAYQGGYFHDLVYAYFDGTTWQTEIIYSGGTEGESGLWASLALDSIGQPHISFGNRYIWRYGGCGALYYAYDDGATWQHEQVDGCSEDRVYTGYSTLALDSQDRPHIGYLDVSAGDLKYAYPACVPINAVDIAGPSALLVDESGTYQASPVPITASTPITFTWNNGAIGPSATYSWSLTGTYTFSLTAANACGQGWGTRNVRVLEDWPYRFYLPLLIRGAQW